ncbi:MAG: class I SAM-dependent methyltransferase [Hyphomonadaceae bacterium]
MSKAPAQGTQGYSTEAPELLQRYERFGFAEAHHGDIDLVPPAPLDVLDIGAGTGRDAAWFAQRGDRVTAIEPTREMREGAMKLHPEPNITWVEDFLPEIASQRGRTFDLVWMSAVWMHFAEAERAQNMQTVAVMMKPGGVLMITLRHGPVPPGRRMFEVTPEETIALAARAGLDCIRSGEFGREEAYWWTRLWFKRD